MNILEQLAHSAAISAQKREQNCSLDQLLEELNNNDLSLRDSLLQNQGFPVIAEFKRSSPSDPSIGLEKDLKAVLNNYEQMGAAGLSILTEESKFNGSLNDLSLSRKQSKLPLLRKDFITTRYQIAEARKHGANAVLLIARILTLDQQESLLTFAKKLGMEVLMEVHDPSEVLVNKNDVDLMGVNCRDLTNFTTDIARFEHLREKFDHPCLVAESGINNLIELEQVLKYGYQACLIGTALMRNPERFNSRKK